MLCAHWPTFVHSPLHFSFACFVSSIISKTNELFSEFDSKLCLNTCVMAVVTMTPSLGPNLGYWAAEDELSNVEKKSKGLKW